MNHPITDKNGLPFGGLDTETFYDNEYSIKDLGNQAYVRDPRFDCYMVSISFPDWEWAGHPRDCPWEKLRGRSFVSANKGFDDAVLTRMIELGQAPEWVYPEEWVCSANLSVYCGYPRALGQCVEQLFGRKVNKSIRDVDMKGKTWDTMDEVLRPRVVAYALDDARDCRLVWEALAHEWPPLERKVSDLTYKMGARGIYIDKPGVEADIEKLNNAINAALARIPWVATGSVPLSPKALKAYCAEAGIPAPSSLAQTSEECAEWEETYGEQHPVVDAMRCYRRANAMLKKFETIHRRIGPNGRMSYSLKYFGASTGRWSGDAGFNAQNLPRDPMYFDADWRITREKTDRFVDMRSRLTAAPGKKLIVADYAQIEARVTPWVAGDKDMISMIRKGVSVYDVQGIRNGMNDDPSKSLKKLNKALYAVCKAQVLGLDFGCGWFKFVSFAKTSLKYEAGVFEQVFGKDVSEEDREKFADYLRWLKSLGKRKAGATVFADVFPTLDLFTQNTWVNSWLQVTEYRRLNPKKIALWKRLGDAAAKTAATGGTFEIELPSGRVLKYFRTLKRGRDVWAQTTKGGHTTMIAGPLLTENLVQATARDIMAEAFVRLWDAGLNPIALIHDESVVEADMDVPVERVVEIMTVNPEWAKSLPIGAEGEETLVYKK